MDNERFEGNHPVERDTGHETNMARYLNVTSNVAMSKKFQMVVGMIDLKYMDGTPNSTAMMR
ncbi:hypothetical protein DFA_07953 [Cavenderia fasciculata]|uniref:Uncharacterized protein n=1 Tax=Cavenderia fasciculata TaxID=261658 RepID=F4Q4B0_CACFS|nr:uncharacterized protein DFA_07953 [Cavenderia fasciculata]EGG16972.1 hypothetical protein DFA_07953 [Cavenderia fasciculata]|eukprot:XP_004355451.1 hypothetical protein DFA_07953 [Cavenderia fasciculata]